MKFNGEWFQLKEENGTAEIEAYAMPQLQGSVDGNRIMLKWDKIDDSLVCQIKLDCT